MPSIILSDNGVSSGNAGLKSTAASDGALALQTTTSGGAATTAVTIDTSQNVGIGTSSPAYILDVKGSFARLYSNSATTQAVFVTGRTQTYGDSQFGTAGASGDIVTNSASGDTCVNANNSASKILFGINGAQKAQFDSSGNLLVGTTSQIGSEQVGISFADATKNGLGIQTQGSTSGAGFVVFRISSGAPIGNISRVGTTSAVVYNTTSDQRLKSNIEDSSAVLNKLLTVKVRQFDWTEGELHQDYGFIAQELEPILSGIVTKGKTEEDTWQLDYSRLTPHLVKAIQEQQALIDKLTARITALENK